MLSLQFQWKSTEIGEFQRRKLEVSNFPLRNFNRQTDETDGRHRMKVSLALNLPPRPVPKEQQRHIISLKIKPPTAPSPRRHLRDQGHLPPETQQAQNRPSSSSSEETSTKGDSRKRSAHSESLPEPRKIKLHLSTRPVVSPPPTTTLPEQEFDENVRYLLLHLYWLRKDTQTVQH